jgi:uncharacterized small protein (DUF1192 family)
MAGDEEPIDVVLSVGELDDRVAAVREFLHRSGALEVRAVVDRGAVDAPVLISCGRAAPIEVVDGGRMVHLPHAVELDVPTPDVPDVPTLPPFDVDPAGATVTGPLGAVHRVAEAVGALAAVLGGRSVAMAFMPTSDHEVRLGIAARPGEPPVLTLGDEQFELPG